MFAIPNIILKSVLFKSNAGIYHVFSQYFSNCHTFKNTCGQWLGDQTGPFSNGNGAVASDYYIAGSLLLKLKFMQ